MFRYRHSGLLVASDIALPEWEAFACDERVTAPDVRIELSDNPCPDCPTDVSAVDAQGNMRFAVGGVGGWEVVGGNRIVLHPSLASTPREVRLFTLGSAWGALGYQRGFAMWHGSAVTLEGRTVLFCGEAGEGKSTIAAALLERGATLVADDLSRVDAGESALIYPSSARIKLWREAVAALGWQGRVIERDYMREDKFHCSVPHDVAGGQAVPLDRIVILRTGDTLAREDLTGGDAVKAVLAATVYRPEMLERLGRWTQQAVLASAIVARCKVMRLTRPRDLARLDEAIAMLL